mgnify:CR=1 FL=1
MFLLSDGALVYSASDLANAAACEFALLRALDAFKVFEYVFAITRGGPGNATDTLQYLIYRTGFQFFRLGEAAAMGFVLVAIVLVLVTFLYRTLLRQKARL